MKLTNSIFILGSARPISTASDSPDLGHDRASLGESTSSMFEVRQ